MNETPVQQEKRLKEWHEARSHLDKERLKIETLASIEAGLVKYREELNILTSSERLDTMRKEKHHPTKVLTKNLLAEGEPKPSPQHVAHHIIPGKGRWRAQTLTVIRIMLHDSGIRINDPLNGVWLPGLKKHKAHWATPESPTHKSIHGVNYEQWITTQFFPLPTGIAFRQKLKTVKLKLRDGSYPVKIEEAKDTSWSGMT